MPDVYLLWFAILAFIVAVMFFLRSAKLIKQSPVLRFVISFVFLYVALSLFPGYVPAKLMRYLPIFIIFLAAVIILLDFLSELYRNIADALSKNPFRRTLPPYITEIARAAEWLAERKTGALIVVEKKDRLDPFIRGGIAFDAEVKAEILVSLFEKNSIVHDGAVIIRNGRIARVKAFLPVSAAENIPVHMGTRHRSALGITEKTDSLVILSSEERGELRVAYHGYFTKPSSQVELLNFISKALRGKK